MSTTLTTPETDAATFKILSSLQSGTEKVVHAEICAKLERERDEAREQLKAMREAIREVFDSFADEPASDSAWLLDDRQTAALSKLQPFITA